MATIKKTKHKKITSVDKDVEKLELLGTVGGIATIKNSMTIHPKKLKVELPYDLEIPLLDIYLKELKAAFLYIFAQPCSQQHYS